MNLHEFQSKQLLRERGVLTPEGVLVDSASSARAACSQLGGDAWVVKAQVHSGGRGRAGGVVLAASPEAVEAEARRLLGSRLITEQTGPQGLPIQAVLIERPVAIRREFYLALMIDRACACPTFIASAAGGMEIEALATQDPSAIIRVRVHPVAGFQSYQARRVGYALGLNGSQIQALVRVMGALYRLFNACDASLIELNPLALSDAGELVALDAKIVLDDNALVRHPELVALRDASQEDPRELEARAHELNYISLEGDIGCMVNGAGLAMATMDLIQLKGGAPANFLDVGGGTTAERVAAAFKLILSDSKVKAILVNIFGGIVRCDLIAEGIIQAVREVEVRVPIVVRLAGTRAEEGLQMLAASGLAVQTASDLETAAELAVRSARAIQGVQV
ncbi:ADP-forming succinate--CoA ligase subunit beta [Caldichromatium japonicum]|uniref:Succinate--CoA ligase [ADP-forming] subunit beta n=1 Tax=Caldichromatium japonicum TaxID=2699430 RepID=A0A6G7VAA7_9GAMM|nr:ADP-forming succinate--CoA ligase subunit beta [Caldichromatium japonicum]QIK37003.1 ADP-forming succinate--CoA ligase subunit beta [Caldichromatium japonicum]